MFVDKICENCYKVHFAPVHIIHYTLPGIPSVYYGSELGIEGKKERFSDDSLRPALDYEDYKVAVKNNPCTKLISALGRIRQKTPALCYGDYKELELRNTYFAFERTLDGKFVIVAVNNSDSDVNMTLLCGKFNKYAGALSGTEVAATDGYIKVTVPANYGEIWISEGCLDGNFAPVKTIKI